MYTKKRLVDTIQRVKIVSNALTAFMVLLQKALYLIVLQVNILLIVLPKIYSIIRYP
jgi:hypothetical protein